MSLNFYRSKLIFFGFFTLLCSGFPLSSLFALPGVCSRSFGGLMKYPENEHFTIVLSIILNGFYLLINGIGLINLSGCMIRLGIPSDYPNSVVRALLYSYYRADINYTNKYSSKNSDYYFQLELNRDSKNFKYRTKRENLENYDSNPPLLTTQGELKRRFKRTMKTFHAKLILFLTSVIVIICLSYSSFMVLEGSQTFWALKSVFDQDNKSKYLSSEFNISIALLTIAFISVILMNLYEENIAFLNVVSWINFFALIFFSIIFTYFLENKDSKTFQNQKYDISFEWDIHIWGVFGAFLEIGTFIISSLAFHFILPIVLRLLSKNQEIKSAKVWGITISLTLFIFICNSLTIIGLIPSFPLLPYGFEPNSEGISMTLSVLSSKLSKYNSLFYRFIKQIFLIGNFVTWILFTSIAAKCIDNLFRCIFDEIDCEFEFYSTKYISINKRYFLRSTDNQINDGNFIFDKSQSKINNLQVNSITSQHDINRSFFNISLRQIFNSFVTVGIFLTIHYKLVSQPQIIPLYKSFCTFLFTIITFILPSVIFWIVFYADMIPNSTTFFQKVKLIFFGRINRIEKNTGNFRDRIEINSKSIISCNPLTFGFFSVTLPILIGSVFLVYEATKIFNLLSQYN